jgi:copper chaperone CopZ
MNAPAALAAAPACARCTRHAESVFRVEGMCCGEEAAILRRRLTPITGIEDVSADIVGQRLHVKYDAALLSTNHIVEAVGETGMRAWLEHEEPVASPSSRSRSSRRPPRHWRSDSACSWRESPNRWPSRP